MLNVEFVKSIFQKLCRIAHHSEYSIDDPAAQFILDWFLRQNKLPHTEKALKFLIFQIFINHFDNCIDLHTVQTKEELSLDYWDEIMVSDCDGWYETYFLVPV